MLLSPQSSTHEGISERSEVGPVVKLVFNDVWYVDFSINVEDLYLVEVNAFSDVVFIDNELLHTLSCELFWLIYMVAIVAFSGKIEVDVG